MGSSTSSSKTESQEEEWKEKGKSFVEKIKSQVQDEVARRAMMQREVQMAVNIAKARDNLQIFGSAWLALFSGATTAKAMGRQVPPIVVAPIVVGALVLGNMVDMAYGNKLQRVNKEAEYILDNERGRFVPFRQAPFAKFYTEEEKASYLDPATAVGDLFPSSVVARGSTPKK